MKIMDLVLALGAGFVTAASWSYILGVIGASVDPIARCEAIWWSDSQRIDCLIDTGIKARNGESYVRQYIARHGLADALNAGTNKIFYACKISEEWR